MNYHMTVSSRFYLREMSNDSLDDTAQKGEERVMAITERKFYFDYDHLLMLCSYVENVDLVQQTESLVQAKMEDLEVRWTSFNSSYESLMLSSDSAITKEVREKARVNFTVCSEAYYASRSRLLDISRVASSSNPRAEASRIGISPSDFPLPRYSLETQAVGSPNVYIKVPPCDTEVFRGGYEEWPSFRDMFTAVYVNHPKLTPAQKLYHLRNKTQGSAGAIVKRYTLCDENFDLAWKALKIRYENKRVLVDNQLKILFNIPVAEEETSESVQRIQSTVNDCLSTLKTLDVKIEHWDPILIYLISTKLPDRTLSLWEQSLKSHNDLPMWSQLDEFLIERFEIVERLSSIRSTKEGYNHTDQRVNRTQAYHSQEKLDSSCPLCEGNHSLRICQNFRNFSEQERIDFVFKNKLCNNCLSPFHKKQKCKSRNKCFICQKSHHTLLHLKGRTVTVPESDRVENASNTTEAPRTHRDDLIEGPSTSGFGRNVQVQANYSSGNETILLRTALVQIEHRGELFTIRALIDPGSQRTFLSERIRDILRIPYRKASFDIFGIGEQKISSNKECELVLFSSRYNLRIPITAIVLPKVTQRLPSVSFSVSCPSDLREIDLADPSFNKSSHIDLILGNDSEKLLNIDGIKRNICGEASAYNTVFGWVLSGPMRAERVQTFTTHVHPSENSSLNEILQKFWDLEEIPTSHPVSDEDHYCEELYRNTTVRGSDGRYTVRLPFKKEFSESMHLGSSRFIALGQLSRMEQSLSKNPELQVQYTAVLDEYLSMNHMEETSCEEVFSDGKFFSFYLPHHAVVRPEHKSTKVRIVFNASRKSKSGYSLNDVLLTGPTLQTDLISTVLNWRKYKYVFSGDIQKMYRQILVHPNDRPYQRILYQRSSDSAVKDYQLRTVTFGVNCAPFLAIRTLLQLASDCETQFPKVSNTLRKETYVDDILSGGFSLEETKELQTQLIFTLKSAGFPLKKITANDSQLLTHLPPEDIYDLDFLRLDETSSTKTLGIKWNALSDSFSYTLNHIAPTKGITKRTILSAVAQLFDPAGWITPIIIRAKMLLQQLWLEGLDWDTPVSQETHLTWESLMQDFSHIANIKIPRWIRYMPSDRVQIHGFADASKAAYCACVYVVVNSDCASNSNLVVAKSKVAPLRTICLPRLELNGAELLARLTNYVLSVFDFKVTQTFLWTDSSIVLGWLSKPPWSWETFVANRTSKIHSLVPNAQWRHVPSHDNPADLGTRGCKPKDLVDLKLWWNGPSWITGPLSSWPEMIPISSVEPKKLVQNLHVTAENMDILDRFSSYNRALRVISYIFRFYRRLHPSTRSEYTFSGVNLSHEEIWFVRRRLIELSQRYYFKDEYTSLLDDKLVSKKSSLSTLNPFLDKDKLLRVNGRLSQSTLPYNERHPIILPGNSRICYLYLSHLHEFLAHADCVLMCRMVQTEFYIARLKPRVKAIIHKCKICVIFKQNPCSQMMAPLPLDRCTISAPFHVTGIDFAGPFDLKSSYLRKSPTVKAYVSVFVCFATKAVHLEPVVSDNGRNFVGASRVLLREFSQFIKSSSSDISNKYLSHGLEWSFIPPHAPHMGGLWEAAVKSFKHHFKRLAGTHRFTFEQLATLLARIEGVLNSRPISALSEDPTDISALTPGHFLKGSPMVALPEPLSPNLSLINRWTKLKAIHHQFAIRWKEDYLKSLQKRYKWKAPQCNIKKGDLVVVIDELLPPSEWRLGRIEETQPGLDGKTRVVQVRTAMGLIKRPVVKLCLLPSANSNESRNPEIYRCMLCKRFHSIRTCPKFLRMKPIDRCRTVRQLKYCVNCLAKSHTVAKCHSKNKCRKCRNYHHTMLHPNEYMVYASGNRQQPPNSHTPLAQHKKRTQQTNVKTGSNQRKFNKKAPQSNTNSVPQPSINQYLLSDAIRSLASVLCATNQTDHS
ncbi:uncharacterized protein LOC142224446 [Haematobia irritans]|uniref:uncharacterized protein LOC142224446 n=1 Tax=Haematobia irritans TaxID=7368 RepID=UPI003F4FAB3C